MKIFELKKLLLLIGDIALLFLSLYLTIGLRYGTVTSELWSKHLAPFSVVFVLWIIVFFINNLYAVQLVKNDYKFYGYLIQNVAINALIGFSFFYLSPHSFTTLRPFRVLIMLLLIYAILFLFWRKLFYLLTSSKKLANRVLIIGLHDEALYLAQEIRRNPQLGYSIGLMINLDNYEIPIDLLDVPTVKDLTNLVFHIKAYGIQTVVTASNLKQSSEIGRYLFETLHMNLAYYNFPNFYEKLMGKVPVASLEKNWFLDNLGENNKKFYTLAKRMQDIIFSILFSVLSLPLIPIIIAAIKFDSQGPIFFTQKRIGKGGKTFTAIKFRSMTTNAEQEGAKWATKNDPRVTRIGKFLRKMRLDEIPQFINILKGDMSFVGPRPEQPEFVASLSNQIPFYNERLLVTPGLSGWAQINYKYGDTFEDAIAKLQYDLYYVKNRSFILDISIILKTINTVINASLGQ